jgi:CBS domain-containing protein
MNAKEIMKTVVHTAKPGDSVHDIVILLGQEKISGLPVVDEFGNIVGVITEIDLLRAYKEDRSDQPVDQLMTRDVINVTEDAELNEIVDLFLEKGIRRVFVAKDTELLGVISRRDLVLSSQISKQVTEFARQLCAGV